MSLGLVPIFDEVGTYNDRIMLVNLFYSDHATGNRSPHQTS